MGDCTDAIHIYSECSTYSSSNIMHVARFVVIPRNVSSLERHALLLSCLLD